MRARTLLAGFALALATVALACRGASDTPEEASGAEGLSEPGAPEWARCWAEPSTAPGSASVMTVKCQLADKVDAVLHAGDVQVRAVGQAGSPRVFPAVEAAEATLEIRALVGSDPYLAQNGSVWTTSQSISPTATQANPIVVRQPYAMWTVTLEAPSSPNDAYQVAVAPYDVSIAPFVTEIGKTSVLNVSAVTASSGQSISFPVPLPQPRALRALLTYDSQGENFTDPVEEHTAAVVLEGPGTYAADPTGLRRVDDAGAPCAPTPEDAGAPCAPTPSSPVPEAGAPEAGTP